MTPFPLSRSDWNTKILITIFLLVMLVSFGVAELNVYDKVGKIKNGVALRYGPDPELTTSPENNLQSPEPSLPSNLAPTEENTPLPLEGELVARMNTFSTLLDITHPHVFEIPLVLFVLAHFLMRTRAPEFFKLITYAGSFGGCVAFLATPWLVRYLSTSLSNLLYIGAILMGLTVIIMVVVPLIDMWRPAKKTNNS
ncbi:MAG: hypothetical protein HY819_09005 [Acidobacteria bacterium]|nr:hypothetical protein [Acidobacteriota bacterium]